jgi:hypothetical protein
LTVRFSENAAPPPSSERSPAPGVPRFDTDAGRIRGIDYLLFRSDGVGVLDVYEVLTTERWSVSIRAHGYFVPAPEFELPAPEACPVARWARGGDGRPA